MHVNYEYLLKKCELIAPQHGRILDYGCGKGRTVEEGMKRGLDIFGVEAFSHGSGTTIKEELQKLGLLQGRVLELQGSKIPFPDHYFDMVISNQVFEHVVQLEEALEEINRVLKPGGMLLTLFPSKEVIREGHCGLLFAHWLPKSKFRYYWLLACRSLGFGRLKRRRTKRQWAAFFNNWLSAHVTYRSTKELHHSFDKQIGFVEHFESDYVAFRLKSKGLMVLSNFSRATPIKSLVGWSFRKLGGLVVMTTKVKV